MNIVTPCDKIDTFVHHAFSGMDESGNYVNKFVLCSFMSGEHVPTSSGILHKDVLSSCEFVDIDIEKRKNGDISLTVTTVDKSFMIYAYLTVAGKRLDRTISVHDGILDSKLAASRNY